jgi:hypothetical protein
VRKLALLLAAGSLFVFFPRQAQAQFQIFGGYSYARPSITGLQTPPVCPVGIIPPCPPQAFTDHPNLNGWELSGAFNHHWIGAVADFGGNYGSVRGASTHFNTYLFGPQVRLPGPVSPFAHVLLGGAHESIGSSISPGGTVMPSSGNAFAVALGAGIDIKVAPFLSLRAIQLDYLVTRFGSSTQNQPRASAGLVLHF